MRQQFVDAAAWVDRQTLEHVLQVRIGFMPIDARGVKQAHDRRRSLARTQAAGEQPIGPVMHRLACLGDVF